MLHNETWRRGRFLPIFGKVHVLDPLQTANHEVLPQNMGWLFLRLAVPFTTKSALAMHHAFVAWLHRTSHADLAAHRKASLRSLGGFHGHGGTQK